MREFEEEGSNWSVFLFRYLTQEGEAYYFASLLWQVVTSPHRLYILTQLIWLRGFPVPRLLRRLLPRKPPPWAEYNREQLETIREVMQFACEQRFPELDEPRRKKVVQAIEIVLTPVRG